MRSPEDFPADIRETAWELARHHTCADPTNICTFQNGCGCANDIARALMERDRAATESAARVIEALDPMVYSREFIDWLAAAIRSQPSEQLAASDPEADALIARSRVVSVKREFDIPEDNCFKRAKEQDAKCRAVFGPTWSMEQAADLFRLLDAERLSATERAAKICDQQADEFLSPQYATNQPFSSVQERFACRECAAAIRSQP
jgi:hypothetical protein